MVCVLVLVQQTSTCCLGRFSVEQDVNLSDDSLLWTLSSLDFVALADWTVKGGLEINPGWYAQFVTKTLINVRHSLMRLIDLDLPMPVGLDPEVWETLKAKLRSAKAQEKSMQMRAVSKSKSNKETQMRSIEKRMMGELVTCASL